MGDPKVQPELVAKDRLSEAVAETELDLPEGWKVARLGDLAVKTFGGGTPSTKKPEFWDGYIPWTTTAIIGAGDTYLGAFQRGITEEGLKGSSAQIAPKNSVLIGTRVGVGKAVVTPFDVAVNQDITVLVLEPNVVPEFVALSLKLPSLQRWFSENKRGTTIKGVPRSDVLGLQLTLPPLHEQRAVTHALRTVQKAIETTEKVIEASRELKRSLMNHLFTYGPVPVDEAEQVPLRETEIGAVPEHWDVVKLGDVAHIGNGSTPKRTNPAYWEGGTLPWLTSGKVHEVSIKQADEYVTEAAQNECHLPLVPKGSVVIAITGQGKTLGSAAVVEFDTSVSQHLAYLRFQAVDVKAEHVLAFLQQRYGDLRKASLGGGSTKGALTCRFLKTYPLPLPPIDEQREITRALSVVNRKVAVEESRKVALEMLFKTLLHNLMTGKVRVNHLDLSAVEAIT